MGWFSYECPEHGLFKVSLNKRQKEMFCPVCKESSKPILKVSTFQVVERLDNGAMARRVERLHNIEEIMDERDAKHSKKVMEKLEQEPDND